MQRWAFAVTGQVGHRAGTAEVQKYSNKGIGGNGYQISQKKLKPLEVAKVKEALDTKFGSGPTSPGTKDWTSTSIGPTFGRTVAKSAIIAIMDGRAKVA